MEDLRVQRTDLEALEVYTRLELVRIALGELLECENALNQRGLHAELVDIDERS